MGHVVWVIGGSGVVYRKIKKNTLNFEVKELCTLAKHRLSPAIGDNALSLACATLITGLMANYDFDIREFLARELRDYDVGVRSL